MPAERCRKINEQICIGSLERDLDHLRGPISQKHGSVVNVRSRFPNKDNKHFHETQRSVSMLSEKLLHADLHPTAVCVAKEGITDFTFGTC